MEISIGKISTFRIRTGLAAAAADRTGSVRATVTAPIVETKALLESVVTVLHIRGSNGCQIKDSIIVVDFSLERA
jgi:hypothetical protein